MMTRLDKADLILSSFGLFFFIEFVTYHSC